MKTLNVGRTKYTLHTVDGIHHGLLGEIDYSQRTITLATKAFNGAKLSAAEREQAFWHEVVHAVLYDMRSALESNERFVDLFADGLTQVIKQVLHGRKLVPHVAKRLRKLPAQVSRNARTKEAPLRRNTTNTLRKRTPQSSRAVRERRSAA